jgi:hypothetical protein
MQGIAKVTALLAAVTPVGVTRIALTVLSWALMLYSTGPMFLAIPTAVGTTVMLAYDVALYASYKLASRTATIIDRVGGNETGQCPLEDPWTPPLDIPEQPLLFGRWLLNTLWTSLRAYVYDWLLSLGAVILPYICIAFLSLQAYYAIAFFAAQIAANYFPKSQPRVTIMPISAMVLTILGSITYHASNYLLGIATTPVPASTAENFLIGAYGIGNAVSGATRRWWGAPTFTPPPRRADQVSTTLTSALRRVVAILDEETAQATQRHSAKRTAATASKAAAYRESLTQLPSARAPGFVAAPQTRFNGSDVALLLSYARLTFDAAALTDADATSIPARLESTDTAKPKCSEIVHLDPRVFALLIIGDHEPESYVHTWTAGAPSFADPSSRPASRSTSPTRASTAAAPAVASSTASPTPPATPPTTATHSHHTATANTATAAAAAASPPPTPPTTAANASQAPTPRASRSTSPERAQAGATAATALTLSPELISYLSATVTQHVLEGLRKQPSPTRSSSSPRATSPAATAAPAATAPAAAASAEQLTTIAAHPSPRAQSPKPGANADSSTERHPPRQQQYPPRNGKAQVAPPSAQPRPDGVPSFGRNNCWAAVVALIVGKVVSCVNVPAPTTPDVAPFKDRAWLREHGAKWVADLVGRDGRPSDAVIALRTVLRRVESTSAAVSTTLSRFVVVAESQPAGISAHPIAALFFDPARKHWSAATRDTHHGRATWFAHDASTKLLGRVTPRATAYVWLAARRGGAQHEPACACGKPADTHGSDHWRATCPGCNRTFIGGCTRTPKKDRGLYGAHMPWRCADCAPPAAASRRVHDAASTVAHPPAATPAARARARPTTTPVARATVVPPAPAPPPTPEPPLLPRDDFQYHPSASTLRAAVFAPPSHTVGAVALPSTTAPTFAVPAMPVLHPSALFQCRPVLALGRGGADGGALPAGAALGRRDAVPEAGGFVAQHGAVDLVAAARRSAPTPADILQLPAATATPAHVGDSVGARPAVSGGPRALAPAVALPTADVDRRRHGDARQVRDEHRRVAAPLGLTDVERGEERLGAPRNDGATDAPSRGDGDGHRGGHVADAGRGDPRVPAAAVAELRAQGRRREARDVGRDAAPERPLGPLRSGGQGRPLSSGQVPRHDALPGGAPRRAFILRADAPAWQPAFLPVAGAVLGSARGTPRGEPVAQLPLGAPRCPAVHRDGPDGHGGDADALVGAQERRDAAPLPRLGPHQRTRSPARAKRGAQPVDRADSAPDATLAAATPAADDAAAQSAASSYTLAHAAHHQPRTADILRGSRTTSPQRTAIDESPSWPAHVKKLGRRIDMDAVMALSGGDNTRNPVRSAKKLLENADVYARYLPGRTARDVTTARLLPHHAEALLAAGIVEPVDPADVRGRVFVFAVPEHAKQRFRVIQHTADVNARMPSACPVAFNSIAKRCSFVHSGSHALQLDFAAYYTQFELADAVRNFFCFRLPREDGTSTLVRLCVGPTGQSHMVYNAVAVTRHLLAFDRKSPVSDDHIDNVLFVGTDASVTSDAATLCERCDAVGVTINEDTSDLAALVTTSCDWCGLRIDFTEKTVALTQKVTTKIRLSWSLRAGWTWRGFAAHLGLLFYSMQVLEVRVGAFFNLLRFASRIAHDMQAADDTLWDAPADVWPSALADLERWTSVALANHPRKVPEHVDDAVLVAVDSCAYGWGYVAFDIATGLTFAHGEPWSPEFVQQNGVEKLRRSTFTEPWGILSMKRHLLPQLAGPRRLRVGTDSVTAAATFRRGYSAASHDLNTVATADRETFPIDTHPCEFVSIAGKDNVFADALSRGRDLIASESNGLEASLRRLLGVSPVD